MFCQFFLKSIYFTCCYDGDFLWICFYTSRNQFFIFPKHGKVVLSPLWQHMYLFFFVVWWVSGECKVSCNPVIENCFLEDRSNQFPPKPLLFITINIAGCVWKWLPSFYFFSFDLKLLCLVLLLCLLLYSNLLFHQQRDYWFPSRGRGPRGLLKWMTGRNSVGATLPGAPASVLHNFICLTGSTSASEVSKAWEVFHKDIKYKIPSLCSFASWKRIRKGDFFFRGGKFRQ